MLQTRDRCHTGRIYRIVFLPQLCKCILVAGLTSIAAFGQNPPQPGQLPGAFAPLTIKEKFDYRITKTIALRGIIGAAAGAGFLQFIGSPPEWGGGVEGYAKRYASSFGGSVVRQSLNFGFETVLKEDPRYFPLDGLDTRERTRSALKQVFLTRTDSGKTTWAYGRIAGAILGGQISRTWKPDSQNGVGYGFATAGISLGVDAAVNLAYEFFPRIRPKELSKRN